MQEILVDEKNGKVIDWRGRKFNTVQLSESYSRLSNKKKFVRVSDCGSVLAFKPLENNGKKLVMADFCKVRLCPMCAWRRSLKIFGQTSQIMDYLTDNYELRYVFVTLSVRNVYGEFLSDAIDELFRALKALTNKDKRFRAIAKGWFRCLEVTHDTNEFITPKMYKASRKYYEKLGLTVGSVNPNFDTYHPHFHMVIAVNPSYFADTKAYISQSSWTDIWQSCLGVDYKPVVHVKTVTPTKGTNDYGKSVAEVAKYAVKSSDYIVKDNDGDVVETLTDEAVDIFDKALANRRLIAYGGLFRDAHKKLNLDDAEDGDLINTDNEDKLREDLNSILLTYGWNIGVGNYIKE